MQLTDWINPLSVYHDTAGMVLPTADFMVIELYDLSGMDSE